LNDASEIFRAAVVVRCQNRKSRYYPCAENTDEPPLKKNLLAGIIIATRSKSEAAEGVSAPCFPHEAKIGGIRLGMKGGISTHEQPIFLRAIEIQAKDRE
jgi:hypothetical protein